MRKTAVYRHDLFLAHQPGFAHPESPDRLRVVYEELDKEELASCFLFPGFDKASAETIGLFHSHDLIREVAATDGRSSGFLDHDTQTSAQSYQAALLAVGALTDCMARLDTGEIDNGFCLVRPPGHHAEKDRAMGYCLFNSMAVAVRWGLRELGLQRIMVIDWDLHHGNGTQESFYATDKVLFCSAHQFPCYPGSGALPESGMDRGEGYTVNVPLTGGQGDNEYARITNELFVPLARAYQPELICVSCGFDIYGGDPLGTMKVTPAGFAYMTRVMVELAEELCHGKLLITLEGGYNLQGVRDGSLAVLSELVAEPGESLGSGLHRALGSKSLQRLRTSKVPLAELDHAKAFIKNWWAI